MARLYVVSLRRARERLSLCAKVFVLLAVLGLLLPRALGYLTRWLLPGHRVGL